MATTSITILKSRVPTKLGRLSAIGDTVVFGLGDSTGSYQGVLTLFGSGGTATSPTYVLEGSLDQGSTWFSIPASSTTLGLSGLVTGDTVSLFAYQYNTSGMAGGLFKFALTAGTGVAAIAVYALVG